MIEGNRGERPASRSVRTRPHLVRTLRHMGRLQSGERWTADLHARYHPSSRAEPAYTTSPVCLDTATIVEGKSPKRSNPPQ